MAITAERIRHFAWSIFGAVGIVVFWEGVWGGIGGLPYLENPWISLVVGMALLSFSGVIYKQYDPIEEIEREVNGVLHKVHTHPQKHEFHIRYHDKIGKKDLQIRADTLKGIEKGTLIFLEKGGKEVFVPVHRVTQVLHKGKNFWKL